MKNEIDSASGQFSGSKKASRDKAIHEGRKSIKKTRAMLRLMQAELGSTFHRENAALRDVARKLSQFRDAFVLIETLDDLKKAGGEKASGKLDSVRAALVKQRKEAGTPEDVARVIEEAASALGKVAKRVKTWPLETNGYAAIRPGLEATYRAGRRALRRAQKTPDAEHFHEMRKRVKDHWYHVRLLENVWSEMMLPYEKSLKDLESWLGDDHNLAVLREQVTAAPERFGTREDTELLVDLIDERQKLLREQSLALAARIYEEKPRVLTRHFNHLWDVWRHESVNLEQNPTAA